MTETRGNKDKALDEEQALATLMQVAGPRPEISGDVADRVYARVLEAWEAESREPQPERVYAKVLRAWRRHTTWSRHRGWLIPAGVAATALLAFFLLQQPEAPAPVGVARVDRLLSTGGGDVRVGQTVFAGDELVTAAGEGLGILLAGGESLRIGENTRVRFDAGNRLALLDGRLYADTGDFVYRSGGLVVETAFGTVRDIGTQFAVVVGREQLDVAVREGRVDLEQSDRELMAVAGERLLVGTDGSYATQDVAPDADYWAWTTELAPAFDIADKSLLDFLKWVARESGLELSFSGNDIRLAAMRTDLHGSVAGFAPLEALQSVMATTAFVYRIEGGRIIVEK